MFPSLNLLLCITRIFFKIEETVVSRLPVNVQASSCQRFVVYEAGRVFDKQQILKSLQNKSIEPLTQRSITEFKTLVLATRVVLVIYLANSLLIQCEVPSGN